MARFSHYLTAQEKLIADLQKDIDSLRAALRAKEDAIRDLGRQLVDQDRDHKARVKILEAELKFTKDLSDINYKFFQKAIEPEPCQEPLSSTTKLRTTL